MRGSSLWGAGRGLVIVIVFIASLGLPARALADLWVSSTGTDSGYCSEANPCRTLSRAVSLAIPDDTIYVSPGTFTDHVTIGPDATGLTIAGSGMRRTIVSGQFTGTVFTIDAGTTVTLQDMTIEQGQGPQGGGVDNAGSLTLERDEVGFNATTQIGDEDSTGVGGGVYSTGPLTIADSAIVANQAQRGGGGVYSFALDTTTVLTRDLVQGNRVVGPPDADLQASGGGLSLAMANIEHSTIAENEVVDGAGGSDGFAGGIFGLRLVLTSDTIADNSAQSIGGLAAVETGTLDGTIVARNSGDNCYSEMDATDSLEYGDTVDTCGLSPDHGNLVGIDPGLLPLAANAGATLSMAITSSSPAYDASALCSGTDQRGVSELQRGATRCDMGAYQVEAPTTYVANPAAGSVTAYASGASGDAAPVLSLSGPGTSLTRPTGVVADVDAHLFVTDAGSNAVTEYAPEATGDSPPVARIVGSKTRLEHPQDVALDAVGHLWVANLKANSLTEYPAGANGNVAPIARIAGTATHLSHPAGVVVDPDGNLRVTDATGPILTFSSQATGNVAPLRRVTSGTGAGALGSPQGLNFDDAGNLVVADASRARIDTLASGLSGPAAPLSALTSSSPSFQHPVGLDLDEAGNLYVADSAANTVSEFASGAQGAAMPIAVISGSDTGLAAPAFLSELPPPPAPTVHVATAKRRSRPRLLRDGIRLRISAAGRRAFRGQPITIRASARVRRRLLATLKARSLRPGRLTATLVPTRAARRLLRGHQRTRIAVLVTIRGGFGTEHRRLSLTSSG